MNIISRIAVVLIGFLLLFANTSMCCAQSFTKIEGNIVEASTNAPIPYVNILFKGTYIGTISDTEGHYVVQTDQVVDTLQISAIGFETIEYIVPFNQSVQKDFKMKEQNTELDEIVILPGENPAHRVWKLVLKNKSQNNLEKNQNIACDTYARTNVSLNELDKKILDRPFFRKHKTLLMDTDSTSERISLPVYFSEKYAHNIIQHDPRLRWTQVVSEEQKGLGFLEETEIIGYTDRMNMDANFYDNYIKVMDRAFASPFHPNGLSYYKFYLDDSISNDSGKEYLLSFKPKNPKNLLFEGAFTVRAKDHALTSIDVKVPDGVDMNFVTDFAMSQQMTELPDGSLFWEKSTMAGNFKLLSDDLPITTQTVVHIEKETSYLKRQNRLQLEDEEEACNYFSNIDLEEYGKSKMKHVRPVELSSHDLVLSQRIDSINNIWVVKSADALTKMFINGYIEGEKFHIGPYLDLIKRNEVEGTRFNITGRTSESLLPNAMLYGHFGYGTRDHEWKYGAGMAYKLPTHKRRAIEVSYRDDMTKIGDNGSIFYIKENMMVSGEDNIFATIFADDLLDQLSREKKFEAKFDYEWFEGLSSKLRYNYKDITSGEFVPFQQSGNPVSNFKVNEVRLDSRLSFDEKVADNYFRRYYLGSRYPIVTLSTAYGKWDMDGQSDDYWNLRAVVKHDFNLFLTSFNYVMEAGKTFGAVPFPMLEVHRTDPSYGLARYSFNMLDEAEYASDEFASIMYEWHLNGMILHQIPVLKEMGVREVVSGKALWGRQANDNASVLDLPSATSELDGVHAEIGVGLENIFQFFRIEGVWRLTNKENYSANNFGVRVRLDVTF